MGSNCCKGDAAGGPIRSSSSIYSRYFWLAILIAQECRSVPWILRPTNPRLSSRVGTSLDDRFTNSEDAGGVRLTISAARVGDSGVYTLQASNVAGSDTARVRLEVSPDEAPSGDDPPTFLRRLQDLTVKVGTRTRFLVEILSSTECKVTWYRNERRLMEAERVALVRDGNYWCADLASVTVDDAGRWTCTAENLGGRASCSAHLNVLVPKAYKRPEFVEELRALLTEQGTVSLECKVVGVPTPVLRWFKDSREIKAGDVFALTANAEDPTSLGTYTCEAVNCMGRAYSSSKVHVVGRGSREGSTNPSSSGVAPEPPPIFTKELEEQFVRINERLSLSCHIVVPPWPRAVCWYNKEGKVEPSERYHVLEDGVGGYLMEVQTAEWCDEGEWKCVATSAGGRVGITTCYVVMDVPKNYRKPRFMENLQAVLTEEGLVSFECKVVGFPTPVLSWFKDGQELKPGDVYQLTGTNSLGSYCCIARNCMGQASSSAELTVEDIQNQLNEEEKLQLFTKNQAPKFLQGLKSIEAKIDEPFRFTIKVAIPPEPSLLWYRDDQAVEETSRCQAGKEDKGVFYLDIQNLEFVDQAEWKCVARNDFGHSVTSCFLKLIIPRHYKKPRFLENLQAILSDEGAVNLECKVIGVPQPTLKWYKDGEELKPGDIHRIISGQDGTCCLGTYTCEAQNCMGTAASSASLLGFDDSMKAKSKKKAEEQVLQRNLSLSTIHEERTSQMYDTPVGDITLDDKGEISFSFDGKEVSVSLYETPDLTEEEALQIVEMYADQLSENVTEHNVVELPPLRFVKETSTSGNLLMEAIIIDVSPEYFVSPEEDLRTEADIEDISIADENGPPMLSLDQDIGGEDYLEKTMALLSEEKSDIPVKKLRKKSDSQRSADDYFSLSHDQSLSEDKKDDDTQVLSESDIQSFASARSSGKIKSKSSKRQISEEDNKESSGISNTVLQKEVREQQFQPESPVVKPKRERRSSRSSRRSSSGSEKSLHKTKDESKRIESELEKQNSLDAELKEPPRKPDILVEEFKIKMTTVSTILSKVVNDIQIIERDIILKSELMSSAATASRSLEIINSIITPLSEIHSIADAAVESISESVSISSTLFNGLPQSLKLLQQSLTIIDKCLDVESDSKTLVKKTCMAFIENCSEDITKVITEIKSITNKNYLVMDETVITDIETLTNEIITLVKFSAETIVTKHLLNEANEIKVEEVSVDAKHLRDTQKALFELKSPLNSLLCIVESANSDKMPDIAKIRTSEVILADMSASIQDLQTALEQIETLSVQESTSSLHKYNTNIIETVMESIVLLRTSFEQLSRETKKDDEEVVLNEVLNSIKENLRRISSQINAIENNVGSYDVLQSENKLEILQNMAQILIALENNLPRLEPLPEIKSHMENFHKNLTKVLEKVIERNEAGKYFALIEICDAVHRVNRSLNSLENDNILSFACLNNTLKIIQEHFVNNVFESELNCSILSNISGALVGIQDAMRNHAEELSLHIDSEHAKELSTSAVYSTSKANIMAEHIDHVIASINVVKTIESTETLHKALTPVLENICPVLEDLKRNIASIQPFEVHEEEHVSDISMETFSQTLATPLCELNQNLIVLNQTLVENIDTLKEASEVSTTVAIPLHELHNTLQILQQDVLSQYGEDLTPYEISVNMASAVENLQSCIVMIQEQAGVEGIEDMSTLEDISGIKTTADTLPSDHLVLPTAEETTLEQSIEPIHQELAITATAEALQTLNEHITILQNPEIIDALDTLSEVSDYSNIKSVALGLRELHTGIEEILHPVVLENSNDIVGLTNISKLAAIAEPMQELQQSLSVLDKNNIPIYEQILELPSEKIHSVFQNISEFKEYLAKCMHAIFPAMETADKTIEISNKVESLRDVCENIKYTIENYRRIPDTAIVSIEVLSLEQTIDDFLTATDVSRGIKIDEVKYITEQLYENITKAEEELIGFTSQTNEALAQEAKIMQTINEIENNIAVLEQYDFVDLSRVSEISCLSPQLALEIESDSLAQINDVVDCAVHIVQDSQIKDTSVADLMILEDFFKTCKNEFMLIKCLINKQLSHKKIIRLIQEFNNLQNTINTFKTKQTDLKLTEEMNIKISEFFLHAEESLKSVQRSLVKIIDSQSQVLFRNPLDKLNTSNDILKELLRNKKTGKLEEIVTKIVNIIEYLQPSLKTAKADTINELVTAETVHTMVDEQIIIERMEELLSLLEIEISRADQKENREILSNVLTCLEKHQDYKDAIGTGKALILLKCLSDCADMLQTDISKTKIQKFMIVSHKIDDNSLKAALMEMMEPLQILNSQLSNVQEQILSGIEEDSISVDITSTESVMQTMTEIHKEIVKRIESDFTTVDNEDLSLIIEMDKAIQTIQENLKSMEDVHIAQVVKEISKPIEDIEKSLHDFLISEKVVVCKEKASKENSPEFMQYIEQYIELVATIEDWDAIKKDDLKESIALARELYENATPLETGSELGAKEKIVENISKQEELALKLQKALTTVNVYVFENAQEISTLFSPELLNDIIRVTVQLNDHLEIVTGTKEELHKSVSDVLDKLSEIKLNQETYIDVAQTELEPNIMQTVSPEKASDGMELVIPEESSIEKAEILLETLEPPIVSEQCINVLESAEMIERQVLAEEVDNIQGDESLAISATFVENQNISNKAIEKDVEHILSNDSISGSETVELQELNKERTEQLKVTEDLKQSIEEFISENIKEVINDLSTITNTVELENSMSIAETLRDNITVMEASSEGEASSLNIDKAKCEQVKLTQDLHDAILTFQEQAEESLIHVAPETKDNLLQRVTEVTSKLDERLTAFISVIEAHQDENKPSETELLAEHPKELIMEQLKQDSLEHPMKQHQDENKPSETELFAEQPKELIMEQLKQDSLEHPTQITGPHEEALKSLNEVALKEVTPLDIIKSEMTKEQNTLNIDEDSEIISFEKGISTEPILEKNMSTQIIQITETAEEHKDVTSSINVSECIQEKSTKSVVDILLKHIEEYLSGNTIETINTLTPYSISEEVKESFDVAKELHKNIVLCGDDTKENKEWLIKEENKESMELVKKLSDILFQFQNHREEWIENFERKIDDDLLQDMIKTVTSLQNDLSFIKTMCQTHSQNISHGDIIDGLKQTSVRFTDTVHESAIAQTLSEISFEEIVATATDFVNNIIEATEYKVAEELEAVSNDGDMVMIELISDGSLEIDKLEQILPEKPNFYLEHLDQAQSSEITVLDKEGFLVKDENENIESFVLSETKNTDALNGNCVISEYVDDIIISNDEISSNTDKIKVPRSGDGIETLLHHIDEFISDDVAEVVNNIADIRDMESLKASVVIAKELRENIASISSVEYSSGMCEKLEEHVVGEICATLKLQNALSNLQQQILEYSEELSNLSPEAIVRVKNIATHLEEDLKIATIQTIPIRNAEVSKEYSMNQLENLLKEISNKINQPSADKVAEDTESLQNTLDEVQTVIIKLKRDFDGTINDTLNETLEDLECSVRSVQLQINEDSPPELLREACATLQLLVNNINETQEEQTSETLIKKIPTDNVLEKCSTETNDTVKLLDVAMKIESLENTNLNNIVSNLNNLKDTMVSLRLSFMSDSETLIDKGVHVLQVLDQVEEKVFSLERTVETEGSLSLSVRDSILIAVHSVYGSISNMRGTISSIQKQFMFENFGKPSENILYSLKCISAVMKTCEECNKQKLKKFSKSLRNALNHFGDIKFYINLDKTARLPNDAAFTKIVLEELKSNLEDIKAITTDPTVLNKIEQTVINIQETLLNIESNTTLEVKEKIPIYKKISLHVYDVTSTLNQRLSNEYAPAQITDGQTIEEDQREKAIINKIDHEEVNEAIPPEKTEILVVENTEICKIEQEEEIAKLSNISENIIQENYCDSQENTHDNLTAFDKDEVQEFKEQVDETKSLYEAVNMDKQEGDQIEVNEENLEKMKNDIDDLIQHKTVVEEASSSQKYKEENIPANKEQVLQQEFIQNPENVKNKDVQNEQFLPIKSTEAKETINELDQDDAPIVHDEEMKQQIKKEENIEIAAEALLEKKLTGENLEINKTLEEKKEDTNVHKVEIEKNLEVEGSPIGDQDLIKTEHHDETQKTENIETEKGFENQCFKEENNNFEEVTQNQLVLEETLKQNDFEKEQMNKDELKQEEEHIKKETQNVDVIDTENTHLDEDNVKQQQEEQIQKQEAVKVEKEVLEDEKFIEEKPTMKEKELEEELNKFPKEENLKQGCFENKKKQESEEMEKIRLEEEKLQLEEEARLNMEKQEAEEMGMKHLEEEKLKKEKQVAEEIEKKGLEEEKLMVEEEARLKKEKQQAEEMEKKRLEVENLKLKEEAGLKKEKQEAEQMENKHLEEDQFRVEDEASLKKEKLEAEQTEKKLLEKEKLKLEEEPPLKKEKQETEEIEKKGIEDEKLQLKEEACVKKEKQEIEEIGKKRIENEKQKLEEEACFKKEKQEMELERERLDEEKRMLEDEAQLKDEKQEAEELEKKRLEEENLKLEEETQLKKEKQEAEEMEQKRLEEEKLKVEEEARLKKEKQEAEKLEKERLEVEKLKLEEKALLKKEKQKAEEIEKKRIEEEKLKAEEETRLQKEKKEAEGIEKKDENKRFEEENLRLEEEARLNEEKQEADEMEQKRLEEEKLKAEKEVHLKKEKQEAEELGKKLLEEEKLKLEEQARLKKEKQEAEELEMKRLEEKLKSEEESRFKKEKQQAEELETKRLEDEKLQKEARLNKEKQESEEMEKKRLEEEKLKAEEEARLQREKKEAEELEKKKKDEKKHIKAEKLKKEEEARVKKEKQDAEELEKKRLEEEKLKLEEARLKNEKQEAEEKEKKRLEEEKLKLEEEARLKKEKQEAEEMERKRLEEEKLKSEEEARLKKEKQQAEELEKKRFEEEKLQEEARLKKEKQGAEEMEKKRIEEEKLKAEEEARLQREKKEAEELEKKKKDEKKRIKAEKLKKEEEARVKKEKQDAEELEKKRLEEEKLKLEEARLKKEKQEAEEKEKQRLEEEKLQEEARLKKEKQEAEELEKKRLEEEKLKAEEEARLQREKKEAEELEKKKKDEKKRIKAEKLKKEEEARVKKEKQDAEELEKKRLEEEKLKLEEARLKKEKQEAEEKEKQRLEEEKLQEEARLKKEKQEAEELEKKRLEEEKLKAEEEARLQREKKEAEELEKKKKDEKKLIKAEKLKKEEEARVKKEKQEAEELEKKRLEEEKLKLEEARLKNEKQEAEEKEKKRLEEEKLKLEEEARLKKEKQEAEEMERKRLEEEKLKSEEEARLKKEKQQAEELEKKRLEEEKLQEEARLKKEKQGAEEMEKKRIEEEKLKAEEEARLQREKKEAEELEKKKKDEKKRIKAEKLKKEEEARVKKEKQEAEEMEKKRLEEEKLKLEEQARLKKEKQAAEEMEKKRIEEEKLKTEEEARLQKEKKEAEETEKKNKDERKRLKAEKIKKAEETRLKKEKQETEETEKKRLEEEKLKIEEEGRKKEKQEANDMENKCLEEEKLKLEERACFNKEKQDVRKKHIENDVMTENQEEMARKKIAEESEKKQDKDEIKLKTTEDENAKKEARLKREKGAAGDEHIQQQNARTEIRDKSYFRDDTAHLKKYMEQQISNELYEHSYIKEYQYEPSAGQRKRDEREIGGKPIFVDHTHKDYSSGLARPPIYREKAFETDRLGVDKISLERERMERHGIFKAEKLVTDAKLRSSLPPASDFISRSSELTEKREIRQKSKALSEARSVLSEKRSSMTRDIKRKPVFSTFLTDRTAVEGSRVKLTCSVLSSSEPSVTWYRNGVLLNNKLKYRTKFMDGLITLEVLNAVPTDSAEYSCTVENENGSVSSSANLKVYPSFKASPIPPTFTRSIRDTYHMAENELVLECRIRGQPLPTISWLKDDKPIKTNDRYQAYYLADGVCRLAIDCPTPEDSGKYTCKAENSVWSDQISHTVNFTGKENRLSPNLTTIEKSRFNRQALESRRPHFTNVLSDLKVSHGGTIGLQVEIRGSPTRVEWLREGYNVTESHKNARTFVEQGLYTLALSDVTERETGLYTCRAWSSHGTVDMNAAITVVQENELEGKPAIIIGRPEKDVLISVGEDLNISFRVQGEPKPKVVFMKGMRDITNSQRVCKMSSDDYVKFTLKRSVVSDAGTYCILARNAYGCDRAFVTVAIRQHASSDSLISDWTYPADDSALSVGERCYKSVPDRIPSEPSVVDGGNNWVSLSWPKPDPSASAPVLAYKVESWLLGKEGGARWTELGITPLNSFDVFNLKQEKEYHFRVTTRNRYGWGEAVQTSVPVTVGSSGDRPEFVDILPGQLKILVGTTANLSCRVKGRPTPEVVWMKNGHEIDEEERRMKTSTNGYDHSLVINDVRIEDEARYSCEASNAHGRASTYARLAVVTDTLIWEADAKLKRERSAEAHGDYPPQFTMRLRDRRVQATYPVRLTCQVVGSPAPTVTWYKDGEEVIVDSRRTKSQDEHFHTLEIAPTTLEDGGVYEAMARNSCGAISCRCSLVVDKGIRAYVAPEFCCGLEPLYRMNEGEELRISAVVEAYPSVGITWYRDGVRLRPSRRAIMTLDRDGQIELALAFVTPRDAGVYTCTASNEVGKASTSGKVEVIAGESTREGKTPPMVISPDVPYSKEPMFVRKPRSSEAHEGDTVIIQCEVVGDPKPDVYWLRDFLKPEYYRDASHFKRVGAGPEYRFEIPHAKLDYTGAYSVVAKNVHGEAKAIISLQILAKDPTVSDDMHNVRYGRVEVIPRFERELTDLLCHDGDAIEFECRVSGHPEPDIRWFHYTEIIRENPDFEWSCEEGTARLKIKQVTAEDEGTYTCEAANNLGKATSSACLVVYPPGEPNTLSQRLRRPPALLSAASTPRSTPRSTPARSVSRTPGPDPRRLCSPSRQLAPNFYTYPFNKVVEEGESVVFQCAVKGLPAPWATWDKDGIILTPSSRITIKEKDEILRILEIEQVTIEDVGVYRITLENDYGRVEATARLEVITRKGKFYAGVRANSPSCRSTGYRRRTPSTSKD
ncbi:titin homolog isoform X6 [Plodia interpunctella]|uniref:titin homolog isoform X6 n=1 Tax=Plodia interpunctella TaxID=58824 RepID=UPI002368879A|nr:titin homolog isoform X6 [Plodia interpunctella]